MRQEGALWAPSPIGRAAQEDALRLLDESHRLLLAILLGVVMQVRSLELERCQLLGDDTPGTASEVRQLQLGASLLSVWALMGFHLQAQELDGPCEQTLGSTSLTIGLIRLMKLLNPEPGQTEQDEIADITEPLE